MGVVLIQTTTAGFLLFLLLFSGEPQAWDDGPHIQKWSSLLSVAIFQMGLGKKTHKTGHFSDQHCGIRVSFLTQMRERNLNLNAMRTVHSQMLLTWLSLISSVTHCAFCPYSQTNEF